MEPLRHTINTDQACINFATRSLPAPGGCGEQSVETLLSFGDGSLRPLLGATGRSGLQLGPPQQLPPPAGTADAPLLDAAYDSFSDALYISYGGAIGQVTASNALRQVAGHPLELGAEDGPGPDARLRQAIFLCPDGQGCLYCVNGADSKHVVRLQLPTSWRAAGPQGGAAAAGAVEQATVTTLPFELPDSIAGLAFSPGADAGGGVLIIATATALYRLPRGAGGAALGTAAPVLWVGREGEVGSADGSASQARFSELWDIRLDAEGAVLLGNIQGDETAVRRVAPDGTVSTLACVSGGYRTPFILPNGYLALCSSEDAHEHDSVLILDLGLKPPPVLAPASPTNGGPPRRTLRADMGALLDAQPDGTADLTLVVASRRFRVHRAILIARSDYFKRRLALETFADGTAAELSLPDTDPAIFELLLRFIYTGAAAMSPALAPSVAELADRLLLPELFSDAQAVILSAVTAETVVGSLLWAERLGGSFAGLLSALKAWYLEHHEGVLESAGESAARLAESPGLMLELMRGLSHRAKRQRIAQARIVERARDLHQPSPAMLYMSGDMAHAASEAAEYTPSLPDVLQQLELPAAEVLVDILTRFRCVGVLCLTCRALQDLADASVRIPKMLTLQLRADGAVAEPLSALERWGRRSGIGLLLQLPAEAAAGVNALLPAAFTQLPEEARRRVTAIRLSVESPSSDDNDSESGGSVSRDSHIGINPFLASSSEGSDTEDSEGSDTEAGASDGSEPEPGASEDSDGGGSDRRQAAAPLSGAAVAALAASLPRLRQLDLSDLPSTWIPGGAGEAYAALAALGTLEELELPGVPGLTGVEALAGSLRSLSLCERDVRCHALTLSAAAPLGRLTQLEALTFDVFGMDLGEGPILRNLLRLLPHSLRMLNLRYQNWGGDLDFGLDGTFAMSGGRLLSARLGWLWRPEALVALARDELLPCLGPGGRLKRLSVYALYVDGWGDTSYTTLLPELWRCSHEVRADEITLEEGCSSVDACSALAAVGPVNTLGLCCRAIGITVRLPRPPQLPPPAHAPRLDLPPPEEVLRMALQRITPEHGIEGGAVGGRLEPAADDQVLLVRAPAAAAALEQAHSETAVRAWTQDLERRARAVAGAAVEDKRRPLIKHVNLLPPASAVLLHCGEVVGAAEAVAAAVAANGDGSVAVRVRAPGTRGRFWMSAVELGLSEVMSELWAASCAGEGGPSLQQRVEWALAVLSLLKGLPTTVTQRG